MAFDTRIWFGRPGALFSIPHPKGTFGATRERLVDMFPLGNGGYRIDQMVGGSRAYVIPYEGLSRETFALLQAFADGHEGPGPFALLDPGQRNMLPANVSAATSVTNGGDQFAITETPPADTFNRTAVASGFGTSTSGHPWTVPAPTGHYSTDGSSGVMSTVTVNNTYHATVDTGCEDHIVTVEETLPVLPTVAPITLRALARYTDTGNFYNATVSIATTGVATLSLTKNVLTVGSIIDTGLTVGTHAAGNTWKIIFEVFDATVLGATVRAKAWNVTTDTEPTGWQVSVLDMSLNTGNRAGAGCRRETGNTNGTVNVIFDNFTATPTAMALGSSALHTDAGPRTLSWTFSNNDPLFQSALTVDWPSSTFRYGVPVVSGRALCFSCFVRGGGPDIEVVYTPRIIWRDIAGVSVGTDSGSPVSSTTGWQQLSATGTPPAGALYADIDIRHTSGASIGSIGYFRRFMLNEGSTPDLTWMPGTGVWPVKVTEFIDQWIGQWPDYRDQPGIGLQEDTS